VNCKAEIFDLPFLFSTASKIESNPSTRLLSLLQPFNTSSIVGSYKCAEGLAERYWVYNAALSMVEEVYFIPGKEAAAE
jgi:hypothetical protein